MPGEGDPSEAPASKASATKTRAAPKPRIVQRKSKAEREEHMRKEAERAKERQDSEALPVARPAVRGTRGGRGGRGAASKNERTTVSAGAGVFGAGRGERPDRARGPIDLGVSEALDGHAISTINAPQALGSDIRELGGTGAGGRGRASKQDGGSAMLVDDDVEDRPRRDIERIWISSDDDQDIVTSRKGKQRRVSGTPHPGTGLRPVRAAKTAAEEDQGRSAKNKIKKDGDENAVIDVDTDEMQIDQLPGAAKKDPSSSPDLHRKVSRKSDSRPKDARILSETVEERTERLRLYDDIERLREAFLHKSDSDETVDSKEEEVVFGRTDHDRMFLFQLPPLVPLLYNPEARPSQDVNTTEADQADIQVKAEPDTNSTTTTQKDAGKGKNTSEAPTQILTAKSGELQRLPQGLVGQLHIHKSGRVTLDWGGTDMEVRYGTEVDFLQDVICVQNADAPVQEDGGAEEHQPIEQVGKAYAFGQVRKKMVLIPDWSKLYA